MVSPIIGQDALRSLMGRLVLLPSLFLAAWTLPAGETWTSAPYPAHFEHISVAQGLSGSIVHWIQQDHRGFLWFATDSGLNRYDGYRFLVFRPDTQNPQGSLGGDRATSLLLDHRRLLWITTDSGLSCLDPETLDIQTYRASSGPGSLTSNSITRIAEDKAGNIWIGTEESGLCVLSKDWTPGTQPQFQVLTNRNRNAHGPPTGRITGLHVDHRGAVWFGSTDMGIGRVIQDKASLRFGYFPHDPRHPSTSPPSTFNTLQEDSLGCLWVGSNDGLFLFDPDKGLCQRYNHLGEEPGTRTSSVIMALNLDRSGTLWISNDGGGLSRLLPRSHSTDTPQFQTFRHDPGDPGSLSSDGVQFAFEDNSGVLWVSTYLSGLNKLVLNPEGQGDRRKHGIFQYRNIPADPGSLSGNHVSAFCEDRFGNLWVGTDGSGLNRVTKAFSRKEGLRFERFQAKPGLARALQDDVVLAIHQDSQQRLWLGTYTAGLVRVDQESGSLRFTHYRTEPGDPETLGTNFIRDILDDGHGRLWIATGDKGLNLFDPVTGKARRFKVGKDGRPWMRASPEINKLALDSYDTLWMATPDGLNRMNVSTGECRGYVPEGPGSLNNANILTIHIDRFGNLWAGTIGGGLNKTQIPPWNGPAPRFVHFGPKEGLPDWEIKNILEDEAGQLWLSGHREMCRFDPIRGQGHTFPFQSDTQQGEFIKNSCLRLQSGEMLFGSNDGFSLFHPQDLQYNKVLPSIVLTDVQILNRSISMKDRLRRDKVGNQSIEVHPGESTLTISFAALHFVAPQRNQYSYRLEGLDSYWTETSDQHTISYARIPPGNYVLRVRGSNCDGVWGAQELNLGIHVLPAWYQTIWFRVLIFTCLGGAIFTGARWYLSSLRRRNRFLEEAMTEQTRKLRESEALNALAHLTETAGHANEDLKHWVDDMSREVSRAVDAHQIDVWEVSGENFEPVTETMETPGISLDELMRMRTETSDGEELHPVPGPQGEVHAALRVIGKASPWTTLERQLLASFIHHLGGAYHLKWLRQTLAENRRQRALDRETLIAQGSGALQLCPVCKRCFDEGVETCPEDRSPLIAPRLLPFRFQGRYRLERLLGEGATAQVFEAWDEKLDRDVALKAIKPQNFVMEQTRERFTREAHILARLDHPGIVSIYDTGELDDGTVFLVMERLRGITVGRMLKTHGPARPNQAAFLLRQIASALASTHAKGLIHRDLKPENIFALIGADWIRYKVLDFGLAKTQVADKDLTQSGTLMGTPGYMSPEQARGKSVDWRSDLYSLTVILYEVLSGKPLVHSRALAEVFIEVISGHPTPLTSLIPGCPLAVDSLISQGLAKDPRQRPLEFLAWASRLDEALQAWNRDIPGWPDRFTEDISHSGSQEDEAPPTLQPGIHHPS